MPSSLHPQGTEIAFDHTWPATQGPMFPLVTKLGLTNALPQLHVGEIVAIRRSTNDVKFKQTANETTSLPNKGTILFLYFVFGDANLSAEHLRLRTICEPISFLLLFYLFQRAQRVNQNLRWKSTLRGKHQRIATWPC